MQKNLLNFPKEKKQKCLKAIQKASNAFLVRSRKYMENDSTKHTSLVNKTSHKFTGKLGQKVDKTKCGHNYKIILLFESFPNTYLVKHIYISLELLSF